jgi:hypothetical protein
VLLIVGIIFLVIGASDFALARMFSRNRAAATGGLGDASGPPVVARILQRSGVAMVVIGAVLVVAGLVA